MNLIICSKFLRCLEHIYVLVLYVIFGYLIISSLHNGSLPTLSTKIKNGVLV